MEKRIFKKWVNNLLVGIAFMSLFMLIITIDSEWTKEYFIFVAINLGLFAFGSLLLAKWGRPISE